MDAWKITRKFLVGSTPYRQKKNVQRKREFHYNMGYMSGSTKKKKKNRVGILLKKYHSFLYIGTCIYITESVMMGFQKKKCFSWKCDDDVV